MQSRLTGGMPAKLSQGPRTGYDLSRMGAGASRGFSGKKKLEAAPWSGTWPAPGSTLDLDFANDRGWVRGVGQGRSMDAVTFTRASTGTYIDSTGTLQSNDINVPRFDWASTAVTANRNLLGFTGTLTSWTVNRGNVASAAITPPSGVSENVFSITSPSGNTGQLAYGYIFVIGQTYTFSAYAQQGTSNLFVISAGQSGIIPGYWVFDLSAGTITQTSNGSGTITNVGGGWYRCTVTATCTGASGAFYLLSYNTTSNSVYVCAPQLEFGSSVTAYQPVAQSTTNIPLRPAPTCNGLLIEEARTNRLLWCRDATQSNWAKTDVNATKDQTGIDGVANAASSLTATADGGTCIQTITMASGSRTGSVYLKRLTGTGVVQVSLDGSTWSTVDLSDTEWRRIVLSGTVINPVVGIRLATSGDAVAMDFGQVEDNAGTLTTQLAATSPILTTSAATTRASEVAFISGAAFTSMNMDSPNKASMFAEFMPITLNNTSGNVAVISAENANQASIRLTCGTSNVFGLSYRIGTTVFGVNVPFDSASALLQKQKTFVSWSNQRLSASRNNQQTNFSEVNGTSANLIGWPMTSLGLSASQANGIQSKYISRLVYWPYTQSDTALQEFVR